MADDNERDTNFPPDTHSGTTAEDDFGRTDRYANKDETGEEPNIRNAEEPAVTMTGDGTAWDSGRTSSVTRGSNLEDDVRSADAETPGVPKKER